MRSFGEVDLEAEGFGDSSERCTLTDDPRSWQPGESDIRELLTVPLAEGPAPELPGSIAAAILDVLEQVPGRPASRPPETQSASRKSSPELPEAAYRRR